MKSKINKLKYIYSFIFIAILSVCVGIYAFFSSRANIDVHGNSGQMIVNFTEINITGSDVFSNKGDTYFKSFDVENAGGVPFSYSLKLEIEKGELEGAVLIYIDGTFIGVLDKLFSDSDTYYYPVEHPLYLNESFNHTIILEYHIGASSYYNIEECDFKLKVDVAATQINSDIAGYYFVKNYYEFKQIIDNYDYQGCTIHLVDDIYIQQDVTISKPLNINLAGKTIYLNSGKIMYNYSHADISRIYSSKDIINGIAGYYTIDINTPNSVVLNEIGSDDIVIYNASYSVFSTLFDSFLTPILNKGLRAEDDIVGHYSNYLEYFKVSFISGDDEIIDEYYNIVTPEYSEIIDISFVFDTYGFLNYEVKVWGSDADSVIDTIIINNFYFLDGNYGLDYVTNINGNILLPTEDRSTNSTILWISSERKVLNESGRFNRPYVDTEFQLSALFSVNGVNILRTFSMYAEGKSASEKLREICLLYGILDYVYNEQEYVLPAVADYIDDMEDLISLTFNLPQAYQDIFIYDDTTNILKLDNEEPNISSAYIDIEANFGGIIVNDRLDIRISIASNISFWDAAFRDIMIAVSALDSNLLYGYELPDNYKTLTTMRYLVYGGEIGAYINPENVDEYVKVYDDNSGIYIIIDKLPQDNTVVTVEVEIISNEPPYDEMELEEKTQYRYFRFFVSGVLHYSDEDIEDINLYQELRRIYDVNDDWIITRDEIDSVEAVELDASYRNITSIKGIEFFTNLTSINLSNNKIIDISYLSTLYNVKNLYLNNNEIIYINALESLNNLEYVNLSYNDIFNIDPLKGKEYLSELYLQYNPYLSDFTAVLDMPALTELRLNNTQGVTSDEIRNNSILITAYENALPSRTLRIYKTTSTSAWLASNTTTNNLRNANRVLNHIEPIYEFYNVIYLPQQVRYDIGATPTYYNVSWGCSDSDIINIVGNRAYVTQPVADIDVYLDATIVYVAATPNITLTRFFKVLSRQDKDSELKVYDKENEILRDAAIYIPDPTLRYHLFKIFDTYSDGIITAEELITPTTLVDFSNLGIKDLTGLRYFYESITQLDLRNNSFTDISELEYLTNLSALTINNRVDNLELLEEIENLSILKVYGLTNVNSEENLEILYKVYKNKPGILIYKDSLNAVWNPFLEPMAKALKNLEGIYLLYPGQTISIAQNMRSLSVLMYDGETKNVDVTYSRDRGAFSYTSDTVSISLNYNAMPARDDYGLLNALINIEGTSVTRKLTVISICDTDLYIEVSENNYIPLIDAVPNETARADFIATIINANGFSSATIGDNTINYIPRDRYMTMTSIKFYGMGMHGVRGLELLSGEDSNLTFIDLRGYMPLDSVLFNNYNYLSLDVVNSVDYPNLVSIKYEFSIVDLYEIAEVSKLTTLSATNNVKVVMDRKLISQDRESVFSNFAFLTSVTLFNNFIRDFWAIQELKAATTLLIYSNDASMSTLTNHYLEQAYSNLDFGTQVNYRTLSAVIVWVSSEIDIRDLSVELNGGLAKPSAFNVNYVYPTEYVYLPRKYKSQTENIEWVITTGSANVSVSEYNADKKKATFETPNTSAYIIMEGTTYAVIDDVVVNIATIIYVYVIKRNLNHTDYVDLRDFMNDEVDFYDREFEDNNFVYYALGLISEHNNTGTFLKTESNKSLQMINNAATNGTSEVIFTSIKGIKNFTGITNLQLHSHSIMDIGELYYLDKLVTLYLYTNRIQTLWTEIDSVKTSIFYKMTALTNLRIYNNPQIDDYLPIALREDQEGDPTPTQSSVSKLRYIYIYPASTTYYPETFSEGDPTNAVEMAKIWWDYRKNSSESTTPDLRIVNGQNLNSVAIIDEFFNCIKALNAVQPRQDVSVGVDLYSEVDIQVEEIIGGQPVLVDKKYNISWASYGSSNGIVITTSNLVQSLTTELSYTNHPLRMRVSTTLAGTSYAITKLVDIRISIQGNYEDEQLKVEISQQEKDTVYAHLDGSVFSQEYDSDLEMTRYYVLATAVMPDANFRNYMFSVRDTNPKDGVISLNAPTGQTPERAIATTSMSPTNRAIADIRGIELFNIVNWSFNNGVMKEVPELYITTSSRVVSLTLQNYLRLSDVSNLHFDGDGKLATVYISLADKLTTLNLNNSTDLSDEQYAHIASMTALVILNLSNHKLADYSILHSLYKTIGTINANNYRIYANQNVAKLKKLVFDSQGGLTFASITPISQALAERIVDLEIGYEADGITEHELPTSFTAEGYDKVYGIKWIEIPGNGYTISEDTSGSVVVYSIKIDTDAELSIPIIAQACYDEEGMKYTYQEELNIITSKEANLDTLYHRMSGTIYSRFTDSMVDIEEVMPDPVLRYYFFNNVDFNKDGIITQEELSAYDTNNNGVISQDEIDNPTVRFNTTAYISSLKGIEYLINPKELTLARVYTYDLSPLELLPSLERLVLSDMYVIIQDNTIFERMPNLQGITFTNSGTLNFNFAVNNANITEIRNITNTTYSLTQHTLYNRNAWAYARMYNYLSDVGSFMGTTSDFTNTQDEKYASCILNAIEIDLKNNDKSEVNTVLNTLALKDTVYYQDKEYSITYRSLSKNISFIDLDELNYEDYDYLDITEDNYNNYSVLAVTQDIYENYFTFIARIEYNGGSYERLFVVRYV